MKRKGMAVRVSAWVHSDSGDDYPVEWYFPDRPTRARIRRLLREEGSSQLDDYDIVIL